MSNRVTSPAVPARPHRLRRLAPLAAASLLACTPRSDLPLQEPDQVVAAFAEAIRACAAGLTPAGEIDQAAMAARGWRVVRRRIFMEGGGERELPANESAALRPTDYEVTEWAREGIASRVELARWERATATMQDSCTTAARTEGARTRDAVVAGIARRFGRAPDRQGYRPRGGDFLTPRFDSPQFARYWALPRNDVYLTTGSDGVIGLEVLAMPDRAALDEYDYDRPESRIPVIEEPS